MFTTVERPGHRPAGADGGADHRRQGASGSPTSATTCATPGRRSICFAPSTRPVDLVPGDALLLGFARVAGRHRAPAVGDGAAPGHRRRPAATRRWPGRCGTARPGSRPTCSRDTTGGLNRSGEIVLLVPNEHELLTLGNTGAYWLRVRLLTPAARPADLPGDRRGSRHLSVAAHRRHGARPSTPSRSPGRGARPVGRQPRPGVPGRRSRRCCPRRHGETVRVTDAGGIGGMDRGRGLLPVRPRPTPTSSGTRRPASSGSARGSATPTGRCASTAGSRGTAPRSRSPATGTAAAPPATSAPAR